MGRNGRERILSDFTVDRYVRGVESVLAAAGI
jgi:hypothetical protein